MDKSLIAALLLFPCIALAQTHTMPGSNVVPSGASLTIQSGATITAAGGSTVTGFGGGAVSLTATAPVIVTPSPTTGTGVISLTVGSSGGVQAWDADLDTWATKTPYAGILTITTGKTFNVTNTITFSGADGGSLALGSGGGAKTVAINNSLTFSGTDGSTLNILAGGTLGTAAYTASTAYQAADSDLTTWAGVTPTSGIQTWLATPSSANLRGAVTDENGTGALLFSGATAPDFTTGFTIGAAAATGKIPIGNGTNYVPSTPTFSNAPSTALKWMRSDGTNWITSTSLLSDTPSTAGKVLISDGTNWTTSTPTYPTAAGAVGYTIRSDATNLASYPAQLVNSSVASQSPSTSDVYLTGSNIVVTAGDMKAKGQYKCVFDMTKSAGTGAIVITLRVGTAGTTSDAAIQTYTFGAGTSVADFGLFEVIATWRTVGSGTSAVMQGMCRGTHQLATTGLFNNAAGWMVLGSPSPSSGFNSSTATNIGISFNGSTAFAGTTQVVQAQLQQ